MTSIIAAEQLTKWYGPRLAVDRVSLEVRAGEVMGLLGPNGSGKSTILRILTGYLRPSSGTARIAGRDVVDDALGVKSRIGYVPEDAPLYDAMRVREFLGFMARLKGVARPDVPGAVQAVCDRLALGKVMALEIGKLSRGFRQRVAIAQALMGHPEVLVLDEPANGLDPEQIIEMRELIRSLAGSLTILVTSHILGEMERVADRVAILLGGRLLAVHALRGEGARRRVRLTIHGEPVESERCIRSVPGVVAVTPVAAPGNGMGSYLVEVARPDAPGDDVLSAVAERLADALVTAGFGLVELRQEPVDLEAVFLQLTGSGAGSHLDAISGPRSGPQGDAAVAVPGSSAA